MHNLHNLEPLKLAIHLNWLLSNLPPIALAYALPMPCSKTPKKYTKKGGAWRIEQSTNVQAYKPILTTPSITNHKQPLSLQHTSKPLCNKNQRKSVRHKSFFLMFVLHGLACKGK